MSDVIRLLLTLGGAAFAGLFAWMLIETVRRGAAGTYKRPRLFRQSGIRGVVERDGSVTYRHTKEPTHD